jgi:hypothetical protein
MTVPDQAALADAARVAKDRGAAGAVVARDRLVGLAAEKPEVAVAGAFVGGLILAKILRRLGT